ncbi:MAG: prolipoprotein diacylglyceryl transferase family protein, partial [Runella zeae]
MFAYIIWDVNPEIFSIGSFSIRWYGLLFASGFLIGQRIMAYIFQKEGVKES